MMDIQSIRDEIQLCIESYPGTSTNDLTTRIVKAWEATETPQTIIRKIQASLYWLEKEGLVKRANRGGHYRPLHITVSTWESTGYKKSPGAIMPP